MADLKLNIVADNKGAVSILDETGKKIADVGGGAEVASGKLLGMDKKLVGLATAAGGALVGMFALKQVFDGLGNVVSTVMEQFGKIDQIAKMSQEVGVAVEELSAFELAASLTGTSADIMGRAMRNLARNMTQVLQGTGEAAPAFAKMNIEVEKLGGGMKEPLELLKEIADKFAVASDGADKTAIAMKAVGEEAGPKLIPLLNLGSQGIQNLIDLNKELGLTVTKTEAMLAESINDNIAIMGFAVEGVKRQFSIGLAPAIESVTGALVAFVREAGTGSDGARDLGQAVGAHIVAGFTSALTALRDFLQAIHDSGFGTALVEVFGNAFASIVSLAKEAGTAAAQSLVGSMLRDIVKFIPGVGIFADFALQAAEALGVFEHFGIGFESFGDKMSRALGEAGKQSEFLEATIGGLDAALIALQEGGLEGYVKALTTAFGAMEKATKDTGGSAGNTADEIKKLNDAMKQAVDAAGLSNQAMQKQIEIYTAAEAAGLSLAETEQLIAIAMVNVEAQARLLAGADELLVEGWRNAQLEGLKLADNLATIKGRMGEAENATAGLEKKTKETGTTITAFGTDAVSAFDGVVNGTKSMEQGFLDLGISFTTTFVAGFKSDTEDLSTTWSDSITGMWDFFADTFSGVGDFFGDIFSVSPGGSSGGGARAPGVVEEVLDAGFDFAGALKGNNKAVNALSAGVAVLGSRSYLSARAGEEAANSKAGQASTAVVGALGSLGPYGAIVGLLATVIGTEIGLALRNEPSEAEKDRMQVNEIINMSRTGNAWGQASGLNLARTDAPGNFFADSYGTFGRPGDRLGARSNIGQGLGNVIGAGSDKGSTFEQLRRGGQLGGRLAPSFQNNEGLKNMFPGLDAFDAASALALGVFNDMGVDLFRASQNLSKLSDKMASVRTGTVDAQLAGAQMGDIGSREGRIDALGRGAFAVQSAFNMELPRGIDAGAFMLRHMRGADGGASIFGDIDQQAKDKFAAIANDAEVFTTTMGTLLEQGYEIDTTSMQNALDAAIQSGKQIAGTLSAAFAFDDIGDGISMMLASLGKDLTDTFADFTIGKLLDTTAIAESFSPVYAALDQFAGRLDDPRFGDAMTAALAEGRMNLEGYVPQIVAAQQAMQEFEAMVAEALKPDPVVAFFEELKARGEEATAALTGVFSSAVKAGLAEARTVFAAEENAELSIDVRISKASDAGAEVFFESFRQSTADSIMQGIIEGITQGAIISSTIGPMLAQLEVMTAAAMEGGITDGEAAALADFAQTIMRSGMEAAAVLEPVFARIFGISVRVDTATLDDIGKQAARIAAEHGLLPADVDAFLRAAKDLDPDDVEKFFRLLREAEEPFRVAAEDARKNNADIRKAYSEDQLVAFFKAMDGLDPAAVTEYFEALQAQQLEWRQIAGYVQNLTGLDQNIVYEFLNAAKGVDPEALTAYFEALGARDAAEAAAAEDRATSMTDLQDHAIDAGTAMSSAAEAAGALAFAAQAAAAELSTIAGPPLAAKGGDFSGMAITGEAGPELVMATARGFRVIPLSGSVASQMLGGGVRGLHAGGNVARPHSPENLPEGHVPHNITIGDGDGFIRPAPPPDEDGGGGSDDPSTGDAFELGVSMAEGWGKFIREGITEFAPFVKEELGESIFDAVVDGFQKSAAYKKAMEPLNKAVEEAMEDGVLTMAEAEGIEALGKEARNQLVEAARAMEEPMALIAESFGITIEEEIEEIADPLEAVLGQAGQWIGSSISEGVWNALMGDDVTAAFDAMQATLKFDVFTAVANGLMDAFIQGAVIQGALAPMMLMISDTFTAIIAKEVTVAEGAAVIGEQVGLIMGVLNGEEFAAGFSILTEELLALRDGMGITGEAMRTHIQGPARETAKEVEKLDDAVKKFDERIIHDIIDISEANAVIDPFGNNLTSGGSRVSTGLGVRDVPRAALGGNVLKDGLAVIHAGETIIPANGGGGGMSPAAMKAFATEIANRPLIVKVGSKEVAEVTINELERQARGGRRTYLKVA